MSPSYRRYPVYRISTCLNCLLDCFTDFIVFLWRLCWHSYFQTQNMSFDTKSCGHITHRSPLFFGHVLLPLSYKTNLTIFEKKFACKKSGSNLLSLTTSKDCFSVFWSRDDAVHGLQIRSTKSEKNRYFFA